MMNSSPTLCPASQVPFWDTTLTITSYILSSHNYLVFAEFYLSGSHTPVRTFCTLVREASGDEFLAMRLARDIIPGVNNRYINASLAKLRESLIRYSPLRFIRQEVKAGESLVETGESRTPPPYTDSSLERNLRYLNKFFVASYPNTSELYPEDDPTQLLPHLLDQLVVLGQLAQQLNLVLGGNGHRPEKLREVIQQLTNKGGTTGNE